MKNSAFREKAAGLESYNFTTVTIFLMIISKKWATREILVLLGFAKLASKSQFDCCIEKPANILFLFLNTLFRFATGKKNNCIQSQNDGYHYIKLLLWHTSPGGHQPPLLANTSLLGISNNTCSVSWGMIMTEEIFSHFLKIQWRFSQFISLAPDSN